MTIYLCVKTHSTTGLKYLCQTTNINPHKYAGSGKYWKSHIKKYGYDVTTVIIKECNSMTELKESGLYYSNLWNVVDSRNSLGNKIWANLIPESGQGVSGPRTESTKQKLRDGWNDNRRQKFGQKIKQVLSDPNKKLKMSTQQQRIKNDPINKLKSKQITTESWNDSIIREKRINAMTLKGKDPDFKKTMSKVTLGSNNPAFDHTLYTWKHDSGNIEKLTRFDLCKKYSLHKSAICLLVQGNRKFHKGWELILN